MNGSCAGGTGAFIDQMATLLKMGADEMNKAAENAQRNHTIASRCGVIVKERRGSPRSTRCPQNSATLPAFI